ncbi:hypothetical protein AAWM_03001 [Aspergillus awamori]|uniref:Uncharacterized protein n=1 Tax=Aspergillus awamori TaxID=105351 RepID=A0A401KLQ6_ASPAW|nr:hypothetical protein AAWM_03001 [Aspergillus awamori]
MHQEATVEYSVPYDDSSRAPPPQPPYNGIETSHLLYWPYLQGESYPWGFFTVKTQPSSVVASSYTQQVRLLANRQAVSYFPDLCVPVNGNFHRPKADLSWCMELEWQVYSAHNEILYKEPTNPVSTASQADTTDTV